jgi:WD40 repeat protein|tara:strand:- start:1567 stop:2691 length:1125 start_codon:yes stop_codon:yes gene_type:complete
MLHSNEATEPAYDSERYTRATVAESPSLLTNNLTAGPGTLAYVHDSQALMVPQERLLIGARTEKLPILTKDGKRPIVATQVKIVTIGQHSFFVLCTTEGVHFFDARGYDCLHYHGFEDQHDNSNGPGPVSIDGGGVVGFSAKGVCSSCSRDGHVQVCVGTASGKVLVFEHDGVDRFNLTNATLETNERCPSAACASEVDSRRGAFPSDCALSLEQQCVVVTANECGTVTAWDALTSDKFQLRCKVKRKGPVTGLAVRNRCVIIAETSGVVGFLSLKTENVFCEMQAHLRYLSAMDIHPNKDVFATVSEDGTIGVWSIGVENDLNSKHINSSPAPTSVFAQRWPDGMLTGVVFCGDGCDALAVCAYDETEICAWQ